MLEPMRINEAKVIWIGIGLWAAAFVVLLPFRKTLISDGHGWWLYTCLAGAGLGMVGLPMVGRRKTVMARETEHGRGREAGPESAGRADGGRGTRDGRDGRDGRERRERRERRGKGGKGRGRR
jgi:hypothetical protein